MSALWQLLMSLIDSANGWEAIAGAILLTLGLVLALVIVIFVALLVWGLFMYVRRFLGRRALWRQDSR